MKLIDWILGYLLSAGWEGGACFRVNVYFFQSCLEVTLILFIIWTLFLDLKGPNLGALSVNKNGTLKQGTVNPQST